MTTNEGMYYSTFPADLDDVYKADGKKAGTYIFNGDVTVDIYYRTTHEGSWSKQN